MLLLYYIISSVSEPSMIFSISCGYVICDCDICDNFVTGITSLSCHMWHYIPLLLSKSNKKEKKKEIIKEK